MEELRSWKKAFEIDIKSISYEMSEIIQSPCIIFFNGEVGAGKTTFIRDFLLSNFDLDLENVSSPTYSLVNDYGNILHLDLYRLNSKQDLPALELPLYFEDKEIILVEWGEQYLEDLVELVPENFFSYAFSITYSNAGKSRDYKLELLLNRDS